MSIFYGFVALIGAIVAALAGALGGLSLLSVLGCAVLGANIAVLATALILYIARS